MNLRYLTVHGLEQYLTQLAGQVARYAGRLDLTAADRKAVKEVHRRMTEVREELRQRDRKANR